MEINWRVHLFLAGPLGAPAKHFLSFQNWLFLLRNSGGDSSLGQGERLALHRLSVPFKRERGKEAEQQTGCEEWCAPAGACRNENRTVWVWFMYR